MTLWEFNLRAIGYARQEQFDWAKFRRVAFFAMKGPHLDYKKLPKTEKDFMQLPLVDGVKNENGLQERQVKAFSEAMQKYNALKQVHNGR